ERGHGRAGPGEHDRGHAVPAAVVEDALLAEVAELRERGPDPRLVVEVRGVVEPQPGAAGAERAGPAGRLPVVKELLGGAAVRIGAHGVSRSFSREAETSATPCRAR